RGCVVNPAGVMVRKRVYEVVGPFSTSTAWGIDWDMWIRIALQFNVAYLADILACYREHSFSGTSAVAATARNGPDELKIIEDVFARISKSRPDLASMYRPAVSYVAHRTWCMAETMCRQGFMRAARAGLRQSVRISPTMLLESRVWALWIA